jgi:hypothetical protein
MANRQKQNQGHTQMTIHDLYCILQGDEPSIQVAMRLIDLLGVQGPVQQGDMTVITGKTALLNFIESQELETV